MVRASAKPCVPVHVLWNLFAGREFVDVGVPFVPATRVVHVSSDGSNVLDNTSVEPCLELEVVGFGVTLVAHLSYLVGALARGLHEEFSLEESACERFFDIHVLAHGQGEHADWEVRMVGGSDSHSLEFVANLVEHLTEIAELFGLGIHTDNLLGVRCSHVDIAESHDVDHAGSSEIVDNLLAAVTDADICYFHFFVDAFFLGKSLTVGSEDA